MNTVMKQFLLIFLPTPNTRSNNYKLVNHFFHCGPRKYFFSARIVYIWNSLPNSVVDASTMNEVNAHRARLVPGWVTVFGRVYHLGM